MANSPLDANPTEAAHGTSLEAATYGNEGNFDNLTSPKVNFDDGKNNPAYQGEEIESLSDDEHAKQLKRVFEALQQLPAGEVSRLADTAEKRADKWPDGTPKVAPVNFQDRIASENLPDFLRRVYGEPGYLNGTMTTANIEILDPSCGTAIRNWIKHHGELPNDINLPNRVEKKRGIPVKIQRKL